MGLIVGLPNHGSWLGDAPWSTLLDLAATAEEAGAGGVSVVDHLVMGTDLAGYPYGRFPDGPDAPWLDPLTTLAAIGGRTTRLRLLTGVLIAPLRPAAVLAKAAATLDVLTGGRLVLGVGTGWQAAEYAAVGLDFADRHRILDEQLAAMRALWSGQAVDVASARQVICSPRPQGESGVPVWIGGGLTARNLERIVRWGDGWIPAPGTGDEELVEGVARLRAALADAGRDPGSVRVRVAPRWTGVDGFVDHARRLLAAGGTDVFLLLPAACPSPDGAGGLLRELGAAARDLG